MPARGALRGRVAWWGAMVLVAGWVNWVVAWACVLWSPRRDWGMQVQATLDGARPASADEWSRLAWASDPALWDQERQWTRWAGLRRESGVGVLVTRMELDGQDPMRRGSGRVKVARVVVVECGWPWLCLSGSHLAINPDQRGVYPPDDARWPRTMPDGASNWRGALQAPASLGGRGLTPWIGGAPWFPLPYGVRATGFALGTLFWLGAIATPGVCIRRACRSVRRHRGRCAECGYSVGALARCPECGWLVRARGESARAA